MLALLHKLAVLQCRSILLSASYSHLEVLTIIADLVMDIVDSILQGAQWGSLHQHMWGVSMPLPTDRQHNTNFTPSHQLGMLTAQFGVVGVEGAVQRKITW